VQTQSGKRALKVVSGEKEGGSKVYSINGYYCGTLALVIFSSLGSAPILMLTNFCSSDSCTIGRQVDAKGRHGSQNCIEGRQQLLMGPVETAL